MTTKGPLVTSLPHNIKCFQDHQPSSISQHPKTSITAILQDHPKHHTIILPFHDLKCKTILIELLQDHLSTKLSKICCLPLKLMLVIKIIMSCLLSQTLYVTITNQCTLHCICLECSTIILSRLYSHFALHFNFSRPHV